MAVEIINGKNPGDIPVKTMKDLKIYINKTTAKTSFRGPPGPDMKEDDHEKGSCSWARCYHIPVSTRFAFTRTVAYLDIYLGTYN